MKESDVEPVDSCRCSEHASLIHGVLITAVLRVVHCDETLMHARMSDAGLITWTAYGLRLWLRKHSFFGSFRKRVVPHAMLCKKG